MRTFIECWGCAEMRRGHEQERLLDVWEGCRRKCVMDMGMRDVTALID
jgi:hypothetical protein